MTWQSDLDELARERGAALVGYAYLLTGDLHGAQDLVQEALVRTFVRRSAASDVAALEAYVRMTILNVHRDAYRKRRTWLGVRHMVPDRVAPTAPDDLATSQADVRSALVRLTPRERACIVLRHYDDLTVPEIAHRLGLSEGSVKRYLSDARARLGDLLDDPGTDEVDVVTTGGFER